MRQIFAGLYISLDGVTESPGEWTATWFTPEVGAVVGTNMADSDAMLLGRRTYQEWAGYWPGKTSADDPFSDYINTVPKYVASRTLTSLEWPGSTLLGPDLAAELAALKEAEGKKIAINGSITLVRSLLQQGLLDELRLLVFPVVLGTGRRLFEGGMDRIPMKLVNATAFDSGVISVVYVPSGAPA